MLKTPEALALIAGEERLSYGELAARMAALAQHLRALGVGPEVPVAIFLPRRAELQVALLATHAAGGFYVPLDPAYPAERVGFMLEDSGAAVVLTTTELADRLPAGHPARIVRLDDLPEAPREVTSAVPAISGNLAYLIYTSGSTGRPKAVAIEHRSAVALMLWSRREYSDLELSGVLASTSITFDMSVFELFAPLAWGGTVILAENALALPELPAAGEVRVIDTVPSAMAELLRMGGVPSSVVTVNLGGEAVPRALADRVYAERGIERLYNVYGPSEDTTFSTWALIERESQRAPSIGRPLDGEQAWVVDGHLQPLPVGVAGELYLGGEGVSRGYLGRPELTAERFVPDPFAAKPGARMYRVGDLARYRPHGVLEFLGRLDHQVKVRGFRVEPGEVESVLLTHEAVRAAVVLPRTEASGSAALVAYLETAPGAVSAGELRQHLKSSLPDYMVPAAYAFLESLPLTPNGKVDRKALKALPFAAGEAGSHAAPRTPAEELVAGIFAEVLGSARVGVEESFFELGGHSLLATQVVSRLRTVFRVELPVRALFEAPTVAALADRIERMRTGGTAGEGVPPIQPILPVPRGGRLAPSFAQSRLWFLDQLQPGSPLYNLSAAVRLTGELDRAAFAAALGEILRRHEVLRTTFQADTDAPSGEPVQVISAASEINLPVVDLAVLPAVEREREAARLTGELARRPFDLARDPMLRGSLLALTAEEHVAVVTLHHIASDGWSIGVLTGELAALYAAFREGPQGMPSPLPELAIQYADYAAWQRRQLSGERLEAELAFWRQRLLGAPPALELPTDRPHSAVASQRGAEHELRLGGETLGRLAELSRRQGSTLFMTLLAAFAALLARHTGQDDLVVGTPIAGRTQGQTEGLIGLFVNTLALRVDLAGSPSFLELLGRVRETALAAYAHQELPFERLVEELAPERDLRRPPLVQAMLVLQNTPAGALALPGLELEVTPVGNGMATFELTFTCIEAANGLTTTIEYDRDLFDAATIERLAGHFERLLAAALAAPEKRVGDLVLLSAAERRELLAWGAAPAADRRPTTVPALFAAQAARAPEAVALSCGGEQVTYGELDGRVEQLARHLRRLGVEPEAIVGVCLEPSIDLVIALLAVWRAGGAFLPLDPAYPVERLTFMLEDSGAPLLLTRRGLVELAVPGAAQVLLEDLAALAAVDAGEVAWASRPEGLAYVIYTSGSTGRPKGVAVLHGAAADHMETVAAAWELAGGDRVLQFASPSFDVWLEETLPALIAGSTLVLRGTELWEPARFLDRVRALSLTVIDLPTAYWQQWIQDGLRDAEWTEADAPALRLVVVGGEAMPAEAARLWGRSPLGGVRLLNAYGPTEGVISATFHAVDPLTEGLSAAVALGAPLAGRSVHVLDRRGHLVPAGVAGELVLGGALLALGYLRRPELTAERFVPDPFSPVPGARLYRTGDLARSLTDGRLEYLGRIDSQVKVRGFRIELGEVEAALLAHSAVRAAVVLASGGTLAAYVETSGAVSEISASELRTLLQGHLPEYMVPTAYRFLESLPQTGSGKLDRRALAALPLDLGDDGDGAPRSPAEELVAGIFAEVLDLPQVGIESSFFELGGHSLLAIRVLSRLREAFGVSLPVKALFEAPTVAALAAAVTAARRESALLVLPPLVPAETRGERLPLSFPQQRLWFMERLAPDNSTYNMPFACEIRGSLDVAALAASLTAVVGRHEILRSRFLEVDGQPWQEIAPPGPFPLVLVDLSGLAEERRRPLLARLGREEAARTFDLCHGPLLRAGLVRLAADDHVLLLTQHHIVSDGVSGEILQRDLSLLYAAAVTGRPSPLPAQRVQYGDFALWQRSWPEGMLESQLAYWRETLTGLATLEVPTDHPRPPVLTFRGRTEPVVVPAATTVAMRELARAHGVTLFMAFLAVWQAVLQRLSGQPDLAVGTPVANRNRPEIEEVVGFFVNMLALRTDFRGSPSFAELLGRVRRVAMAAYDHTDVPFERLVDELSPGRDLSRQPLVQVMFTLEGTAPAELTLPGVEVEVLNLAGTVAKFDLTLELFAAGAGWTGHIEYNSDLFDRPTVARLAGHFANLAAAAVAAPQARLADLELLSAAERQQILGEWNDTDAAFPETTLLHQFFEAAVERTPAAIAAVCAGRELTYAALEARSNRLARLLRGRGVERGTPVGVWVERSFELLVGVLGVLKAGGHYVALDDTWPAHRVESILAATGAPAIVVGSELLPAVEEMRWRLPSLADVVCPGIATAEPPVEALDLESVAELWDFVAERAVDRVTAGGFVSAFTDRPFSEAEVDEYRDRVLSLASPWLHPE